MTADGREESVTVTCESSAALKRCVPRRVTSPLYICVSSLQSFTWASLARYADRQASATRRGTRLHALDTDLPLTVQRPTF